MHFTYVCFLHMYVFYICMFRFDNYKEPFKVVVKYVLSEPESGFKHEYAPRG
jgi:hypothetical protein